MLRRMWVEQDGNYTATFRGYEFTVTKVENGFIACCKNLAHKPPCGAHELGKFEFEHQAKNACEAEVRNLVRG